MDTSHGRSRPFSPFLGFFNLEFSFYFTVKILMAVVVAVVVEGDGGTEKVGIQVLVALGRIK